MKGVAVMKKFSIVLLLVASFIIPNLLFAAEDDLVGYNNGFYIKSKDDNFRISFGGEVRPKYQFLYTSKTNKSQSFKMRRLRFDVKTTLYKDYYAFIRLLHSTQSADYSAINVEEAYVGAKINDYFTAEAGMLGLPLEFDAATSLLSEGALVITQSDGIAELTPLRSSFGSPFGLGVNAKGEVGKFSYEAAVINGNDTPYVLNKNLQVSAGFRVGYNILGDARTDNDYDYSTCPQLSASFGFNYQGKRTQYAADNKTPTADIKYILTEGLGAGFRYMGFSFTGNAFLRQTKIPWFNLAWARNSLTDFGYYVTTSYFIIPKKLEIVLQGGQIFRQGPDNNSNQLAGGLNYYILGKKLILTTDYFWTEDYDDIKGLKNNQKHLFGISLKAKF